jgi:hypothetical protein
LLSSDGLDLVQEAHTHITSVFEGHLTTFPSSQHSPHSVPDHTMGDAGLPPAPRIAIIGAGLTGLLTAHGLQKAL